MPAWELRPLSLGEILDRTFTLYRRHFLLFLGIAAIPQLLILALNLAQILFLHPLQPGTPPAAHPLEGRVSSGWMEFGFLGLLVGMLVYLVAYLFAQGGTIFAVSELYLGRPATIAGSLGRMWGQAVNLLGVMMLNGMAVFLGLVLLIGPGIYLACRLITCIPAALLEDLGARSSLERSFALTKDHAGRAFVIYLLYFAMIYAATLLFAIPFGILMAVAVSTKDPTLMRTSLALWQVGNFFAGIFVTPFFLIAISVFYYDLRVRKEAFDLQLMMNPSGHVPSGGPGVPSLFS